MGEIISCLLIWYFRVPTYLFSSPLQPLACILNVELVGDLQPCAVRTLK